MQKLGAGLGISSPDALALPAAGAPNGSKTPIKVPKSPGVGKLAANLNLDAVLAKPPRPRSSSGPLLCERHCRTRRVLFGNGVRKVLTTGRHVRFDALCFGQQTQQLLESILSVLGGFASRQLQLHLAAWTDQHLDRALIHGADNAQVVRVLGFLQAQGNHNVDGTVGLGRAPGSTRYQAPSPDFLVSRLSRLS